MGLRIEQNEKRDFIRMQVDTHAQLKLEEQVLDVRCQDLSSTGARLVSTTDIEAEPGMLAELTIDSGCKPTRPLEASVEVVRVTPSKDGTEVAVKILSMK